MDVRLGTSCGLNLSHVTHWTYEEEVVEPPPIDGEGLEKPEEPEPPLGGGDAPAIDDPDAAGALRYADVPAPSSAPPAPVAAPRETPPPVVNKTLTLYMVGRSEPLVYTDAEAAALLGIFVSQSGSLT